MAAMMSGQNGGMTDFLVADDEQDREAGRPPGPRVLESSFESRDASDGLLIE